MLSSASMQSWTTTRDVVPKTRMCLTPYLDTRQIIVTPCRRSTWFKLTLRVRRYCQEWDAPVASESGTNKPKHEQTMKPSAPLSFSNVRRSLRHLDPHTSLLEHCYPKLRIRLSTCHHWQLESRKPVVCIEIATTKPCKHRVSQSWAGCSQSI